MNVFFEIPTTDVMDRCFLTWVPVKAQLRLVGAEGPSPTHRITLRNAGAPDGGKVIYSTNRTDPDDMLGELNVDLPSDGSPIDIWVAGEFDEPSIEYGDAVIEATDAANAPIGSRPLMVRVRKNAIQLKENERNRFLEALGTLNDAGKGPFKSFREMHDASGYPEEHGFAGFLPWHRAYLLDLERSLQQIDATVTLPYWRFDQPAPALFAQQFLGMPDPQNPNSNEIVFPHGHPLEFWRTDENQPIFRRPRFFDINEAPPAVLNIGGELVKAVISQNDTLDLGEPTYEFMTTFADMENTPHNFTHGVFDGPINNPTTSPKDPLFFLLHCNVDRLWALWQVVHKRTKEDLTASYPPEGSLRADPSGLTTGSALEDTMWPWNGDTNHPRPSFDPPRPSFPESPFIDAPGAQPTVRSMIDFQGVHTGVHIGCCYDAVPFQLEEDHIT